MKILLDENLPHDLRHLLPGHHVVTVDYLGLKGLKNGELLRRAADHLFDAILTLDTSIPFTQHARDIPVAVIVIQAASNRIEDLSPLIPSILQALVGLAPRSVVRVAR